MLGLVLSFVVREFIKGSGPDGPGDPNGQLGEGMVDRRPPGLDAKQVNNVSRDVINSSTTIRKR